VNNSFSEIFIYFFRLGCLGFGGPLALISSMQKDLISERKWMEEKDFNGAFSLIKAMPGPVAFMSAVYLGRSRGGLMGGFLAGFGLVFPPAVLMILFSYFFKTLLSLSFTAVILTGMQVCALGVILGSVKGLIKSNMTDVFFWFLIFCSGVINYFKPELEPIMILSFGFMLVFLKKSIGSRNLFNLGLLFLVCFKAGALVFGSGLAIVPMLKHDVVTKYQWLSETEFLDALAFGQMTPGPVVITATFIGHHLHGLIGAIVATVGIFLASFFHMMTWFPSIVKKMQGKKWISDFIFGAVAAVVGPIIVTVIKLFMGLEFHSINIVFAVLAFILTLKGKWPLWAIIPGGGVIYYFVNVLI
jgi:chromate transporter